MNRYKSTNLTLLTALALGSFTAEAQLGAPTDRDKTAAIPRTAAAPKIDGVLDDAVWGQAARIDDLHQFDPVDHGEPSERTELFLLYDEDFLYVGARLHDSEPGGITARQLVQGASTQFDDALNIILDPFNNKRTGYSFQVNPNGVRSDGVFETPSQINRDWEGIWFAEASVDADGWVAEYAIPFKTLNFDPANDSWGFTAERAIARKQELIAWVSYNRQVNPGASGLITGLADLEQGLGLDIVPSLVVTDARDLAAGTSEVETDPAVDIFYKFTPSMTGVLTLNTDFSATEVDDRQINLTRFSQFFPEKRDFFLQDVDIFSFGGLNQNGIPFFSRRIGLSQAGQPVDLDVGAKLTGRVGRWNIGVLDVQQDAAAGVDAQNLFVGRVAANVLAESSVGLIATDGDPRTNLDNSLVGFDFRYRNTNLPSGRTLEGEAWVQQSDSEGVDADDRAFGLRFGAPNSVGFEGSVGFTRIEQNFNPALGFVNRSGIDQTDVNVGYTRRPSGHAWLRALEHGFFVERYDRIGGGLESQTIFVQPAEFETRSGNEFGVDLSREREVLLEPFEIADGIVIPPGDYEFDNVGIEAARAGERAFAPRFEITDGEFFDGDRLEASAGFDWRPTSRFLLGFDYEYNEIELPAASFTTRLIQINANYAFNVRWSWVNLIQYDNVSGSAGINSRLRWNPRAGQDLYVVLNHGFDALGAFSGLSSNRSQLSVKYTHTFRL